VALNLTSNAGQSSPAGSPTCTQTTPVAERNAEKTKGSSISKVKTCRKVTKLNTINPPDSSVQTLNNIREFLILASKGETTDLDEQLILYFAENGPHFMVPSYSVRVKGKGLFRQLSPLGSYNCGPMAVLQKKVGLKWVTVSQDKTPKKVMTPKLHKQANSPL
jgi:hypothetical protein